MPFLGNVFDLVISSVYLDDINEVMWKCLLSDECYLEIILAEISALHPGK